MKSGKPAEKRLLITAELSEPSQVKAVALALKEFGRIDGLVNNAGVNDGVGLEHGDYKRFMESLHKNVVHYYLMAHHALPALIKSKVRDCTSVPKQQRPDRKYIRLRGIEWRTKRADREWAVITEIWNSGERCDRRGMLYAAV